MNFNKAEKESFRHVALNILRNGPWIALTTCAISPETGLQSKLQQ